MPGHQRPPGLQHPVREDRRPRGQGDKIDPGADLRREGVETFPVGRGAHVDQRDDDIALTAPVAVQLRQGVEHGVPGGELVVHQDQRARPGEQRGVLGQQQMRGGVGVGLLEAARPWHPRDRAAGRVEIGREGHPVRDRVTEPGRRLRVADDERAARLRVPQQGADALAEAVSRPVHHRRGLRHMFAQDVGDQQMGPLGVAAQGQAQQPVQPFVSVDADAEPFGDPGSGPHHRGCLFSLGD